MIRTGVIAALVAAGAAVAAVPAAAVPPSPIRIAGTQATVDYAHGKFAMRGSLVGAWQVTGGTAPYASASAQRVEGTVLFTGCLDSNRSKKCEDGEPAGTMRVRYLGLFETNPVTKAFLRGSSIEAVSGGTGSFARVRGVMTFVHHASGIGNYRGELQLGY
jgi:hypothetical protein